MCEFYSAILKQNGDILHNPFTISHEDLIDEFNLDDTKLSGSFVRVEFVPKDNNFSDIDNYQLNVDESEIPDWYESVKEKAYRKLRLIVKNMIITGERNIIIGKAVILKDAKISKLKNALVYYMENSQVNEMWGNSQVNEMRENSQVNEMRENSQVNVMWENSQVNVMRENSQVNVMRENSQVNEMWGNSQVNVMRENSQVNKMWGNSQVNVMWENSQVNVMRENSQVNEMRENSQVNVMRENSQVNEMRENSQVNEMYNNAANLKDNEKLM